MCFVDQKHISNKKLFSKNNKIIISELLKTIFNNNFPKQKLNILILYPSFYFLDQQTSSDMGRRETSKKESYDQYFYLRVRDTHTQKKNIDSN